MNQYRKLNDCDYYRYKELSHFKDALKFIICNTNSFLMKI